ncbi:MAG: hypothetical protein GY909_07615 [Oligoflexia bacterium]|nr:hypothetical protein [Oligoflexia bacterium]
MKVTKADIQANQDYLKKLNSQQKGEIASREVEIQNVKKLYEQKVEDEKVQGEIKVLDVIDRNKQQVIEAVDGKIERLDQMKQNLKDTEVRLEKERDLLKSAHVDKMESNKIYHSNKFQQQFDDAAEKSRLINFQTNQTLKNIDESTKADISNKRYVTKLQVDKADAENKMALEKASEGNSRQVERLKREHAVNVHKTELENKNKLEEMNQKHTFEAGERDRIHKDQLKTATVHHEEKIKANEKAFQDKYRGLNKNHATVIKRLKERFAHEIKSLMDSHAKKIQLMGSKKADEFYHTEKLSPFVKENVDSYTVSIPVAEHEKENFNLSADKRTIKLSFARKFDERIDAETGEVFNTRRSETYKKEFQVKDILDSRHIEEMYRDGVLSYKIKKA